MFENCPSVEDLKAVCEKIFYYDRFRSIPELQADGHWRFRECKFDVNKIVICSEAQDEKQIMEQVQDICDRNIQPTGADGGHDADGNTDTDVDSSSPFWKLHRIENKVMLVNKCMHVSATDSSFYG